MKNIIAGLRFNRLTTINVVRHPTRRGQFWRCICDCGSETIVYASHLRNDSAKSCGCAHLGVNKTHGMSGSPEYKAWDNAKDRCYRTGNRKYQLYGGRGIRVCARWRNSFIHFLEDMGPRPSSLHSLDRRNGDGHYEPLNCRWATATEQNNNRVFGR